MAASRLTRRGEEQWEQGEQASDGENEAAGDGPAIAAGYVDDKSGREGANGGANACRGVHEADQSAETVDAKYLREDGGV